MIYARLWFSGVRLYLVNGMVVKSWPAVSGKPKLPSPNNLSFSYSQQAQSSKDSGPIPAGEYAIRIGDIRVYQHTMKTIAGAALFAVTEFKTDILARMDAAWGKTGGASGRIIPILNPKGGTEYAGGRNNCWIHGSDAPGSIGCIDLTDNMDAFLTELLDLKIEPARMIGFVVRYGVTPEGEKETREVDLRGRDISRVA